VVGVFRGLWVWAWQGRGYEMSVAKFSVLLWKPNACIINFV